MVEREPEPPRSLNPKADRDLEKIPNRVWPLHPCHARPNIGIACRARKLQRDPSVSWEMVFRNVAAPVKVEVHSCRGLIEGLTERQTSKRLTLSHHTVHNHVREIYSILNVHSRGELLALLLKPS